jgi:hypothetical protein
VRIIKIKTQFKRQNSGEDENDDKHSGCSKELLLLSLQDSAGFSKAELEHTDPARHVTSLVKLHVLTATSMKTSVLTR